MDWGGGCVLHVTVYSTTTLLKNKPITLSFGVIVVVVALLSPKRNWGPGWRGRGVGRSKAARPKA